MMAIFSEAEYESRRQRLLKEMEKNNLEVLVIYSGKPESGYVRYYCGFESNLGIMDCSFLVIVPDRQQVWTLLTNAFWEDFASLGAAVDCVVTSDFPAVLASLVSANTQRIGITPMRQFPADSYKAIQACCPHAEVFDLKSRLLELRAVKSPAEIALLQEIAAIADRGAEAFHSAAEEGATELDIAADVEYALRRAGSGPFIFSTLVCSGPRTNKFIAIPTHRKVEAGDIIQLDCGPSLCGYHGDFSRVLLASRDFGRGMQLLEDTAVLYECCLATLKPGVAARTVADEALRVVAELGYGPENLYQSPNVKANFFGHGIGLGNPDAPQLSTQDCTMIEQGMVLTIEIILRDTRYGATRIEDAVVVEKNGARRLSQTAIRLWQTRSRTK
jgi:Xaa-Pro aminopeptidase